MKLHATLKMHTALLSTKLACMPHARVRHQSGHGFAKILDLLLLAEAFHMLKLAKAAEMSLACASTGSGYGSVAPKLSEHPKMIQVSRESLIRTIDNRRPLRP